MSTAKMKKSAAGLPMTAGPARNSPIPRRATADDRQIKKIKKLRSPPMTAHARGRPAVDRRLSAGVWTTAKKVGGSATSPPQTLFILSCSFRLTTYHAALGCYATHRMELVCRKTWSFTARSCRDFSLVDSTRVPSVT